MNYTSSPLITIAENLYGQVVRDPSGDIVDLYVVEPMPTDDPQWLADLQESLGTTDLWQSSLVAFGDDINDTAGCERPEEWTPAEWLETIEIVGLDVLDHGSTAETAVAERLARENAEPDPDPEALELAAVRYCLAHNCRIDCDEARITIFQRPWTGAGPTLYAAYQALLADILNRPNA